jgi:integrase
MAKAEGEKRLTDTVLKGLKPAAKGERYEVRDKVTPGLCVRVTAAGTRSFMLKARFGGSKNPTRRLLGVYDPDALPTATAGAITLETARTKAREWMAAAKSKRDPAQEEAARTKGTFASVAEDYIRNAVIGPKQDQQNPQEPKQRQWRQTSRDIRKVFVPRWGTKHVTEIKRSDIVAFAREHGERAPGHTRNLYITLQSLFGWARDQDAYGLEHSPCEGVKVSSILGKKRKRDRVLTDAELRALWVNTRMGYPHGAILKLLILTGLRKNEVAQASWPEINIAERRWIIPARRMKGKNDTAREHLVPLTDDILAVFGTLKRYNEGLYIFTVTNGKKPVRFEGELKKRLDSRMKRMLRDDFAPFQIHDIRRTVRTRLSGLHVREEVREAVLAHARPGVKGNYDVYGYEHEKRDALDLWAQCLKSIVTPGRNNVVPIRGAAS